MYPSGGLVAIHQQVIIAIYLSSVQIYTPPILALLKYQGGSAGRSSVFVYIWRIVLRQAQKTDKREENWKMLSTGIATDTYSYNNKIFQLAYVRRIQELAVWTHWSKLRVPARIDLWSCESCERSWATRAWDRAYSLAWFEDAWTFVREFWSTRRFLRKPVIKFLTWRKSEAKFGLLTNTIQIPGVV